MAANSTPGQSESVLAHYHGKGSQIEAALSEAATTASEQHTAAWKLHSCHAASPYTGVGLPTLSVCASKVSGISISEKTPKKLQRRD